MSARRRVLGRDTCLSWGEVVMGKKGMKTSQPEGEITFPSTDLKSNTAGVQSSRPPDDRIRHRARAGCRASGEGCFPFLQRTVYCTQRFLCFRMTHFSRTFGSLPSFGRGALNAPTEQGNAGIFTCRANNRPDFRCLRGVPGHKTCSAEPHRWSPHSGETACCMGAYP